MCLKCVVSQSIFSAVGFLEIGLLMFSSITAKVILYFFFVVRFENHPASPMVPSVNPLYIFKVLFDFVITLSLRYFFNRILIVDPLSIW